MTVSDQGVRTGFLRRLGAAAAAGFMALGMTACGGNTEPVSSTPVTTATTTTAPTTTTTTAPPMGLNMLTGVRDMATDNNRPIAFVVTDENSSLTQLNLESADMYFEAETEAGIPRIMAIYSSVDRIPDTIGPVRSARPHFVKIAKALDCIYCHIGGSSTGLDTIRKLRVDDLTNSFEINKILSASRNVSWNRSAFTKAKVMPDIARKGYRTTTTMETPFLFGQQPGTNPANTVVVKISEAFDMAFTYSSSDGLYYKHRNALSTPVHKTYTGGTITASNVLIIYDNRVFDEIYTSSKGNQTNRYNFDLVRGNGILATGGTAREIHWTRSDKGLQFFEKDFCTPMTVGVGKTYICLASVTLCSKTVIQ